MSEHLYLGDVRRIIYPTGLTQAGGVISDGRLYIPRLKYFEHLFVQGTTGSGKTTFLEVQVEEALKQNLKIVIVDGAGNLKLAKRLCVLARKHGISSVPVVKFGQSEPELSCVFDGFTGSNLSVHARLVALLDLYDIGTDGDYYRGIRRNVLSLICGVNTHIEFPETDYFEPPRSFQEVQKRLTFSWLEDKFGQSELAMELIKDHGDQLKDLRKLVAERARPFLHILDSRGFKLGDHRMVIFSIDTIRGGQPSEYLFKFLGEAFKEAMGIIGETIWFIDEAGAFGGRTVSEFTRLGRQKGLGIVLALQSMASLKDNRYRDRYLEEILDTTNTKIILQNDLADEMRERAGTQKEKDPRHMRDEKGKRRGESVGFRDNDKIKADDMKNLPKGGAFAVLGSAVIQIQPRPVSLPFAFDDSMEDKVYREDRLLKPPKDDTPYVERPADPFKGG